MKFDGPKVLAPLLGKPMILHLLAEVKQAQIDAQPMVVVGYQKEKVIQALQAYLGTFHGKPDGK